MGRDKALIEIGGTPLWERQLTFLQKTGFTEILISTRPGQAIPADDPRFTNVPDPTPDLGPLAGIHSCLAAATSDYALVVAVDQIHLTGSALPQSGIFHDGQRFHPFPGVYSKSLLPAIAEALTSKDLSLQSLLKSADLPKIPLPETLASQLYGLNSPADIPHSIRRFADGKFEQTTDFLSPEEPLEIRIEGKPFSIAMRTPGHDRELAAGFLLSEGVIKKRADIFELSQCPSATGEGSAIDVLLTDSKSFDPEKLRRNVLTGSSCGLCGKETIASLLQDFPRIERVSAPDPEIILSLPDKMRAAQDAFAKTGGIHACALFTRSGELINLREDVGRHNALDKLIGHALLSNDLQLPLRETILLLSGRVSFEMVQKAHAGGIPTIAAISAPSDLAVATAQAAGQNLFGFVRKVTFNSYGNL